MEISSSSKWSYFFFCHPRLATFGIEFQFIYRKQESHNWVSLNKTAMELRPHLMVPKAQVLVHSGPNWSTMVLFGPMWSNFLHFCPMWSNVVQFGPLCSILYTHQLIYQMVLLNCANLQKRKVVHFGSLWSKVVHCGPKWSIVVRGPIWFKVVQCRSYWPDRLSFSKQSNANVNNFEVFINCQ